jgi:hypothetical protein
VENHLQRKEELIDSEENSKIADVIAGTSIPYNYKNSKF